MPRQKLTSVLGCLISINMSYAAETVTVKAGKFAMGCSIGDKACDSDEGKPGGTAVFVKEFRIDKYEVSVAEYQKCIAANKCSPPKDHKRNKYCNYAAPGREQHPLNCIDWQQALDYCKWRDGRLPYEAEWEKAARGGSPGPYPWGRKVSCRHAVLDDGVTTGSVKGEHDGCGEDRTWQRGSRKPNPLGLYDMHGNAGEWIYNWYSKDAMSKLYVKGDLQGPSNGQRRLVRGGSWDENENNLRSSFRNVKFPNSGKAVYGSIGFRCAYD